MRPAVAFAILLASSRPVAAHQTSIKYVDIIADGDHAEVSIKVAPGDVTEPMRLAPDAKPTAAAAVVVPAVAAYVAAWLAISQPTAAGELPCTAGAASARVDEDGFVAIAWRLACPQPIDLVTIDLDRLFALDKRQEAIVQLRTADVDEFTPIVVKVGDSPITLHARAPSSLRALRAGMDRFYGAGHVAFVLALLVVAMLARSGRGWRIDPIVPTVKSTATVLAAFTLAHLIALLAAGSGWVTLPSQLVAGVIAASIVYTAAENIARADLRWRFAVAFAFGLAHGVGLAAELPPRGAMLAWFAAGVELAELTVVLIALPLVFLVATRLGAERYRRVALPILSMAIAVVGISWFVTQM